MSFQGYLKTIKEKTGLDPQDFKNKAEEKKIHLKRAASA